MINRVVIPIDGSDLAMTAVPFGGLLAQVTGAEIVFITVISTDDDLQTDKLDTYLAALPDTVPALPPYSRVIRTGDPATEILEFAGTAGTIIVMATHGAGGLRRMILGSVADAVVRQATVPVTLVRDDGTIMSRAPALNRILVPLDGSDLSNQALPIAIDLAARSRAELHLLRIVPPLLLGQAGYPPDAVYISPDTFDEVMADLEQTARDDLDVAAHRCREAGIEPVTHVLVNTPIDGILRIAKDIAADVIVMVTHGRGGIRRAVLGSVATGLVQTSDTPLIVVPARAVTESSSLTSIPDDARMKEEARSL